MGLDQWFYKEKKKNLQYFNVDKNTIMNSLDDKYLPYGDLSYNREDEYKYFRKNRLIHNYMYKHYCELAKSLDDDIIDRNDFNMVDVIVTYEDLQKMFNGFINNIVDGKEGFFFGEQDEEDLRLEALEFLAGSILDFKYNKDECLIYTSWW